jgi:hypothetical protein
MSLSEKARHVTLNRAQTIRMNGNLNGILIDLDESHIDFLRTMVDKSIPRKKLALPMTRKAIRFEPFSRFKFVSYVAKMRRSYYLFIIRYWKRC